MLKRKLRLNIKTKDKSWRGTSSLVEARHVKTQDNVRRIEMLIPGVNANRRDRSEPQLPYPNSALQCDLTRVHEALRESQRRHDRYLSLIHISEPTRLGMISYAVFCLK